MAADNGEKELMIHAYCRQGDREGWGGGGCVREVKKEKGELCEGRDEEKESGEISRKKTIGAT